MTFYYWICLTVSQSIVNILGCLLLTWLNFNPNMDKYYIHYNMWYQITYPLPNFNGVTVEVWEWISNFIPNLAMHVVTYPCWIGVYPCWSKGSLVFRPCYARQTRQCHAPWCPDNLHHQVIKSHDIEFIKKANILIPWGRISTSCANSLLRNGKNSHIFLFSLKFWHANG